MKTYVVELYNLDRQLVQAGRMLVADGHLFAMTYAQDASPGEPYENAWAPGCWLRFWVRPEASEVDRLWVSLSLARVALERADNDDDRERLNFHLGLIKAELEAAEDRRNLDPNDQTQAA